MSIMNPFFIFSLLCVAVDSLNVFVVPHSHNDAGWLYTADQYYYMYVRPQLDNILGLLSAHPSYKFAFSEMYFLSRYINDNPTKKSLIKQFISENRLEIVSGGWVLNDEALVDFEMALRQMEAGFEFLHRELDISNVRVGWNIDQFGHSSLTAALWEKLGFEMLVVS